MKDIKKIAVLCFLADIGLSLWSYFKLTNYDEYLKAAGPLIGSPDLQVQLYQVLLQTFTFTLMIFLALHLIIYILLWKKRKYAIKYVRFYSLLASLSCVLMMTSLGALWAVVPMVIYLLSFIGLGKINKEMTPPKTT